MKLLMYSHDTYGLGHIRRTLLIAKALTEANPEMSILILSGSSMIHSMRIPHNVDYIKLPCLTKLSNDRYLPKYLKMCTGGVKKLRREIIFKSIKEFKPDFLLVDKAPIGAMGELLESLLYMKLKRPESISILGIRDILDDPENVRREWRRKGIYDVLETLYDEIWVYGSRTISDIIRDYDLPRIIADKVHYCGYLKREDPVSDPVKVKEQLNMSGRKMVVTTLGGGGDGNEVARVLLEATNGQNGSSGVGHLMVVGPDFSPDELESLKKDLKPNNSILLREYSTDIIDYLNAADLVVSMAGYNTVCEIVSLRKKAILIPRIHPRTEQLIRARRFSQLGIVKIDPSRRSLTCCTEM